MPSVSPKNIDLETPELLKNGFSDQILIKLKLLSLL